MTTKFIGLVAVVLVLSYAPAAAQICCTSNVIVGSSHTYQYSNGMVFSPMWNLANQYGTITNQWQSGSTYYASITWHTVGPETLVFLDMGAPLAQLNITITAPPPAAPTANAATSISTSSFTANWSVVSGATDYRLDVSTVNNFASYVTGYSNRIVTGTSHSVTGLTGNTTYYYRLRAANSGGSSANSNVITVTTAPPAPVATAATNINHDSFSANWNSSSGATSYLVDYTTVSNFSTFSTTASSETTASIVALTGNTTYYYRVRAVNSIGTSTPSSTITVVTLPPPPQANAATSMTVNSFTANWNTLSGATQYLLDVSTASNFSTFVPNYNGATTTATNMNVTGLTGGTTYYYRVRGQNSGWTTGYSNVIQTLTIPNPPNVTLPSALLATSFTANWATTQGAASYRLDVSSDFNFGSFITNNLSVTGITQNITGLTAGTTYYYRVRAVNSSGTSASSATMSALLVPPAPTATAATNRTSSSFDANWSAVTGATSYRLDVSTVNTFASFVSGYNNLLVTTTSKYVSGLATGTNYYYRVRAVNASGASVNSGTITSPTLLNPPIATKSTSITSSSFTANWNAATNATSYRLDVSTDPNFLTFFSTFNNLTVSGITRSVTGLVAKKTYYYRVRAVNSTGTSVNSNTVVAVDLDQNFIRTIDVTVAGKTIWGQVDTASYKRRITNYNFFDGLGRSVQTVTQQGSQAQKDIIQPIAYDLLGREVKKYLPYTDVNESNGWYKQNALRDPNSAGTEQAQYQTGKQYAFYQTGGVLPSDQYPYAETKFESSPLNRPLEQGSPGLAWQPDGTNSYSSTDKTIKSAYESNSATEVLKWTYTYPTGTYPLGLVNAGTAASPIYYAANQLYKTRTKDERHKEVIEYKDKFGRVVLKRVQATWGSPAINNTNYASTYYIYDGFGSLVCVIPPEATKRLATEYYQSGATDVTKNAFLSRWAFRYTYDASRRMTQKQVPGAGAVYMVYDKRDRLALTQDANQRSGTTKYWSFTKYDCFNRPVLTGITISTNTLAQMQTAVDNYYATLTASKAWFESYIGSGTGNMHGYDNKSYPQETTVNNYLTVTYYDNYSFRSLWAGTYTYTNDALKDTVNSIIYDQATVVDNQRIMGQVTGMKVKVLDGGVVGGSSYLKSITYYDDKYRIIQIIGDNNKGGSDRVSNLVDFPGKVLMSKTTHSTSIPTSRTITRSIEYDHVGRMTHAWHRLDGAFRVLIAKNDYNELGQLIDKKLHSTVASAANAKQSVDYLYNIRGWLTKINNSDVSTVASGDAVRDYFGMELGYNGSIGTGNTGLFNGNISGIKWSVNQGYGTMKEMGYNYFYDPMNRLDTAFHRVNSGTWAAGQYDERQFSYDLNGNILALQRYGTGVQIDNLEYNYGSGATASNKLLYVRDNSSNAKGFVDGNTGTATDYSYDANGSMTRDLNKGIGNTISDAINLIVYNFMNLPETVTKGGNIVKYIYDATGRKLSQIVTTGTIQKQTDYIGEFVYENNALQFINHEEGRIVLASTKLIVTHPGESTSGMTNVNTTLTTNTTNGEKYVTVTSNGTIARSGVFPIGGTITVQPGERYRIRAKGYKSTGTNEVYIAIKAGGTDLNWPGAKLPTSAATESWIEQTVTIPAGATTLQAGVTWNAVTSGAIFYLNEFEITQLTTISPEYQYHLKDHLGNVRVTFSSKNETESVTATLESATANADQANFLRYANAKRVNATILDRTNGASTGYSQRLNGSTNEKYGIARSVSVMPGDVVNMEVYAKYVDTNTANWTAALNTLIGQIAANTAGVVVDGASYSTSTSTFPFPGVLSTAGSTGGPKAYLNWLFFDRNWTFVPAQSGYMRMTTAAREYGQDVAHERLYGTVTASQPGYMYIYLSNEETTPVEVYFDDFKVDQVKLPVVQMDDYYPFGLTFNAYQRETSIVNDNQYNNKEFQDELDLNWYDYGARTYLPDIARMSSVDPLADVNRRSSPYSYVLNNPVRFIDPDGMLTYDWASGNYVDDDGNTVDRDEAVKQIQGMGNTVYVDDPREGNEVAEIDFNRCRVVKLHGESTGLFERAMDEKLYNNAKELRENTSFIGPVTNPIKLLEKIITVDDILSWDPEAQAVSAAWMEAAQSKGGYDYVEYTPDGGMIYREVRDVSKYYGAKGAYGNVVTSMVVFDISGNVVYGVDYRGGGFVTSKDGTRMPYIVPFISVPGKDTVPGRPILLKPNVE